MAMGGGGSAYSYGELEGLWISAGGPDWMAPLMAAIAMAESRGNPQAANPSGATGLWQILGAPANWKGSQDWTDPQNNARAAVAKWKQQGLGAWTTYTNGAYKKFFRKGVPPVDAGGGTQPGLTYQNPFRQVRNLKFERTDMGVDFSGQGPVYALGPGRITGVNRSWAGGAGAVGPGWWVTEHLTGGPLKGQDVFLAENIQPQVKPGQRVSARTVIARMTGQGAGIETGFAAPGQSGIQGGTLAAQFGQQAPGADPGAAPTAAGVAYADVLTGAGVPGISPLTGGTGAQSPAWVREAQGPLSGISGLVDQLISGDIKSAFANDPSVKAVGGGLGIIGGAIGGVGQALGAIASVLGNVASAIDWLFHPENWVRILAGLSGGVLAITGVVKLSHTGEKGSALPIGILMVGSGGVLLFIAFHNLPGSPSNVSELAGSLRDAAQKAAMGKRTGVAA